MKVNLDTGTLSPLPSQQVFIGRLREALTDVMIEMAMVSQESSHWVGRLPTRPVSEAFWLREKLADLTGKAEVAREVLRQLSEIFEDQTEAWLDGLVDDHGQVNW